MNTSETTFEKLKAGNKVWITEGVPPPSEARLFWEVLRTARDSYTFTQPGGDIEVTRPQIVLECKDGMGAMFTVKGAPDQAAWILDHE